MNKIVLFSYASAFLILGCLMLYMFFHMRGDVTKIRNDRLSNILYIITGIHFIIIMLFIYDTIRQARRTLSTKEFVIPVVIFLLFIINISVSSIIFSQIKDKDYTNAKTFSMVAGIVNVSLATIIFGSLIFGMKKQVQNNTEMKSIDKNSTTTPAIVTTTPAIVTTTPAIVTTTPMSVKPEPNICGLGSVCISTNEYETLKNRVQFNEKQAEISFRTMNDRPTIRPSIQSRKL